MQVLRTWTEWCQYIHICQNIAQWFLTSSLSNRARVPFPNVFIQTSWLPCFSQHFFIPSSQQNGPFSSASNVLKCQTLPHCSRKYFRRTTQSGLSQQQPHSLCHLLSYFLYWSHEMYGSKQLKRGRVNFSTLENKVSHGATLPNAERDLGCHTGSLVSKLLWSEQERNRVGTVLEDLGRLWHDLQYWDISHPWLSL